MGRGTEPAELPEDDRELQERERWERLRSDCFRAIGNYNAEYGGQHTLNLLTSAIHTTYNVMDKENRDAE